MKHDESLSVIIKGPILDRADLKSVVSSINELSSQLFNYNPLNKVLVVSYSRDINSLRSLKALNSNVMLIPCSDPGADSQFIHSKKGFSNMTRQLKLGVLGLEMNYNKWCCMTRVELLPYPTKKSVQNFVSRLNNSIRVLEKKKEFSSFTLKEFYGGFLNVYKGTLIDLPAPVMIVMKSESMLILFKRAHKIWDFWKSYAELQPGKLNLLTDEQIFGRALAEIALKKNTDDFLSKYHFSMGYVLRSIRIENNFLNFFSFYDFIFIQKFFEPVRKFYPIYNFNFFRIFSFLHTPIFLFYRKKKLRQPSRWSQVKICD